VLTGPVDLKKLGIESLGEIYLQVRYVNYKLQDLHTRPFYPPKVLREQTEKQIQLPYLTLNQYESLTILNYQSDMLQILVPKPEKIHDFVSDLTKVVGE